MIGQVMSILQATKIIVINTNLLMLESFLALRSNNDILKTHHCLEKKIDLLFSLGIFQYMYKFQKS
jgi:hypothetical protein